MNFIERLKAWIVATAGLDKWYHFLAGWIISTIGWLIWNPIAGAACALYAGILKDVIWDKVMKRGTYDPRDIWWTAAGSIMTLLTWAAGGWILI